MKVRADYEMSKWRRFVRFVNGEEIPEEQKKELMKNLTEGKREYEKINEEQDQYIRSNREARADIYKFRREREQKELKAALERYENWPRTNGLKIFNRFYRIISMIICISIILVLLVTVAALPKFGDPDTPANSSEVVERYIVKGQEETGAVNIVTGMILDYRAFDTLGESHVLFIAACTVLILLRIDLGRDGKPTQAMLAAEADDRQFEPKNDKILQKVAFILVPISFIFGIYVILNGHISPGGGFSGGAIIGAGLILYLNAYGFKKTERFFTYKTFSTVSLCALLFYAGSKCYSFFCGANYMESGIPLGTPGNIISSGLILPLNICVGCVVACTMYSFYAIFRKGGL